MPVSWFIPPGFVSWIVVACLIHSPSQACEPDDLSALMEFAGNLTRGSILASWTNRSRCCLWDGVVCGNGSRGSPGNRVIRLVLPNRGLEGRISSSMARLGKLRLLNLSFNRLGDRLPEELSEMSRMEVLDLSHNRLLGPAPGAPFNFTAIRSLNISSNLMQGSVSDLGRFPKLVEFNLSNNSFVGGIDRRLCNSSGEVRTLDLSANGFDGGLAGLENCGASLRELHVDGNSFSGPLPDYLYGMTSLEHVSISDNNFSGEISGRLGELSGLKSFVFSGNRITGRLPDVFGNLTRLESLVGRSNSLSGALPATLSLCSELRVLDLRNNSMVGTIDLDYTGLPRLSVVDFGTNDFAGSLPDSLSSCRDLRTLSLAKNRFTGAVPESFASLTGISFFSVSNNRLVNLSRALSVLQKLRNLTTAILTNNFEGEELTQNLSGGHESLRILALGNCGLRGRIPRWLLDCRVLQVLDLSWNRLHGGIPSWVGGMENLFYLDFSNNSFAGEIPKSLTELRSLISTIPSSLSNLTSIGIPLYVKRNLSDNSLQYNQFSSFPPSILLGHNRINGTIWPEIGNLKQLHVLDLSRNNISGVIPNSISGMGNLEILDLSFNVLHGSIPPSFKKLTFLSRFSVAHNNLQGWIPSGGQFSSFPNSSFDGNPRLRYADPPNREDQKPDVTSSVSKNRFGRGGILVITIGAGTGTALLLATVVWKISRRSGGGGGREDATDGLREQGNGSQRSLEMAAGASSKLVLFQNSVFGDLTVGDVLRSTNNFSQANIIGCGGFGLVYRAVLPSNARAAVKRLSGDCGQMEREFQAEVEALSRAQHPNLVALQGYCLHGSDRLLIYSYMENGSLDYWLHERAEGEPPLGWEARLGIARGAAHGLGYLHKVCQPSIVHRDIKSSNILLDAAFDAHLADFGLSRLLRPYDTHVTTDLVGTLGYIPPEYGQTLTATLKGDVFSFGVVLLELVTGRRPVDVCRGKSSRDLVSWVLGKRAEGREEETVDASIRWEKERGREAVEVLAVACRCLEPDPKRRPSIDQVVLWLDRVQTSCSP